MDSPEAARPGRWTRRALLWLPVLVLLTTSGASAAAAVQLDGPPRAAPAVAAPRPAVPLVDLRRDLEPLAAEAAERRLRDGLEAYAAGMPADTCLAVEVDGVRFTHRADDPQTPASLQKLLTAVAALEALGPDHRFRTSVRSPAPDAGVVAGDVHLVGGGDPLLAVPAYATRYPAQPHPFTDLTALADAVAAAGVARIDGAVVGDESRYDLERYHPDWPDRFRSQGQSGPLSALSVNDGFVEWPRQGLVPVRPAAEPALLAAEVFVQLLADRGVEVRGGARVGPTPDLPELAHLESAPLREVVGQMLAHSDNVTAELLLKELGLQVRGAGTFAAGTEAVRNVLADLGFDLTGVTLADGSGLSTRNALTCGLVMEVLGHEPTAPVLADGLAVAGRTGTLHDRFADRPIAGRVSAKTGTLRQVTALAGFAETDGRGRARFALIVNVPASITAATVDAQGLLAALLVTHPEPPDLGRFRPSGG